MPIIAFEGPDAVGKTTLAENFASAVSGVCINRFMDPYDHWAVERRLVNKQTDPKVRFDYSVRYNTYQMYIAQQRASDGELVTLDTSIYRTIATHHVLGVPAKLEDYSRLIPTKAILLKLLEEERLSRLLARDGKLASSFWDKILNRRAAQVWGQYGWFNLPELDATKSRDELVELARAELRL